MLKVVSIGAETLRVTACIGNLKSRAELDGRAFFVVSTFYTLWVCRGPTRLDRKSPAMAADG